jgi:iron complex transport system substrate-binding protein
MKQISKSFLILCMMLVVGGLLAACNSQVDETKEKSKKEAAQTDEKDGQMRLYKDYKDHKVEIPVSPERVIFHGETFGDLLPLHVHAVGGGFNWIKNHVFEDKIKNVEDVGFPINLEKTLALKPDLIIIANPDEKVYEQLSKIAPTIMFNTFTPFEQRLPELGDILGKKQEAEEWLNDYNKKAEDMWKQLTDDGMIDSGETASVLTYYPGNRLFVMGITGLSQILYHPQGFKPGEKIQEMLDAEKGFEEISAELLPEYAGDRIFILTPTTDEEKQATKEMMESKIWKDLPAVKKGHVYTIDIVKSSSDAATREWLLEEISSMLKN